MLRNRLPKMTEIAVDSGGLGGARSTCLRDDTIEPRQLPHDVLLNSCPDEIRPVDDARPHSRRRENPWFPQGLSTTRKLSI